jgi:hypothetical protein
MQSGIGALLGGQELIQDRALPGNTSQKAPRSAPSRRGACAPSADKEKNDFNQLPAGENSIPARGRPPASSFPVGSRQWRPPDFRPGGAIAVPDAGPGLGATLPPWSPAEARSRPGCRYGGISHTSGARAASYFFDARYPRTSPVGAALWERSYCASARRATDFDRGDPSSRPVADARRSGGQRDHIHRCRHL